MSVDGRVKKITAPRRSPQALRLLDLRRALELSQVELCKRADLSPSLYNMYETGRRRLTRDSALRLHDTFGVSLDYLFNGDRSGLPERLARKLPPASIAV